MPLLDQKTAEQVRKELTGLTSPVRLVVFTQEFECTYCKENRQLAEEIADLSELVEIEVYDFVADKDKAEELNIDKIPATAVIGSEDYGIRFYGIPAGYEFTSLLQAIKTLGTGELPFEEEMIGFLKSIDRPIHLQVFVTPTCPYCPQSVVLAHQMAMASPMVHADMVEATEFPHLAQRYQVMGVPRTVINETEYVEGAAPADMILDKIKSLLASAEAVTEDMVR
ncbi:MAG: thioredoxin family protein [Anaerolineae bacterium]|nr:thioredoxin family protein [Anaerolineae bacterium]